MTKPFEEWLRELSAVSADRGFLRTAGPLQGQIQQALEQINLQSMVTSSVESERRRMGQELHDGLGQELIALTLQAKRLQLTLSAEKSAAVEQVEELAQDIAHLIRQVKAAIRGLMPVELDDHELTSALQQLADQTEQRFGIACGLESPDEAFEYDQNVAHHLFRIAQEAINNAVQHADPRRIALELKFGNRLLALSITDDGRGIPVNFPGGSHTPHPGWGLRTMQYRAGFLGGQLNIESAKGVGTTITCQLKV